MWRPFLGSDRHIQRCKPSIKFPTSSHVMVGGKRGRPSVGENKSAEAIRHFEEVFERSQERQEQRLLDLHADKQSREARRKEHELATAGSSDTFTS